MLTIPRRSREISLVKFGPEPVAIIGPGEYFPGPSLFTSVKENRPPKTCHPEAKPDPIDAIFAGQKRSENKGLGLLASGWGWWRRRTSCGFP